MLMRHLVGALQESQAISIGAADQREHGAPRKRQPAEPLLRARSFSSRNAKVEGGEVCLPLSGETGKDVEHRFQTR